MLGFQKIGKRVAGLVLSLLLIGADTFGATDSLISWLLANRASTGMPLSFQIRPEDRQQVWNNIGGQTDPDSALERIILDKGLIIYDGAVSQIALAQGGNLSEAAIPFAIYWAGGLEDFASIRAGWGVVNAGLVQQFKYDTIAPEVVSANPANFGRRGYIFKLINAFGKFAVSDPRQYQGFFAIFAYIHGHGKESDEKRIHAKQRPAGGIYRSKIKQANAPGDGSALLDTGSLPLVKTRLVATDSAGNGGLCKDI